MNAVKSNALWIGSILMVLSGVILFCLQGVATLWGGPPPASKCNGVPYDSTKQGCCEGKRLYTLQGQKCCGENPYHVDSSCCIDNEIVQAAWIVESHGFTPDPEINEHKKHWDHTVYTDTGYPVEMIESHQTGSESITSSYYRSSVNIWIKSLAGYRAVAPYYLQSDELSYSDSTGARMFENWKWTCSNIGPNPKYVIGTADFRHSLHVKGNVNNGRFWSPHGSGKTSVATFSRVVLGETQESATAQLAIVKAEGDDGGTHTWGFQISARPGVNYARTMPHETWSKSEMEYHAFQESYNAANQGAFRFEVAHRVVDAKVSYDGHAYGAFHTDGEVEIINSDLSFVN